MSKRQNDNGQMKREEVEALDNSDEDNQPLVSGSFQRATADVLAGRKIVKINKFNSSTGFTTNSNKLNDKSSISDVPSTNISLQTISTSNITQESEKMKKIKKLNTSFQSWANRQIEIHPLSIWKEGVKDYIKHYHNISDKYTNQPEVAGSTITTTKPPASIIATTSTNLAAATAAPFSGFSFNVPKQSASIVDINPQTTTTTTSTGFSFNLPKQTTTNTADIVPNTTITSAAPFSGFSFNVPKQSASIVDINPQTTTTTTSTGFSFNLPKQTTTNTADIVPSTTITSAAPFSGFSFNLTKQQTSTLNAPSSFAFNLPSNVNSNTTTNTVVSSNSFSFPGSISNNTNIQQQNDEDGGDDEGEPVLEPEKVLRNMDDKDEILHEVICKLYTFNKEENEWKDTGKGTFRITNDSITNKKRMLVRNQIGKINFNANFYKNMMIEKNKKGIKFSAFVSIESKNNNDNEIKTELKTFMIQLKSDDIDNTINKLQSCIDLM